MSDLNYDARIKKSLLQADEKFIRGIEMRKSRLSQWEECKKRINAVFQVVLAEAESNKSRMFDSIYEMPFVEDPDRKDNDWFVGLYWGSHPVCMNPKNPNAIISEGGAAITFSLLPESGAVVCVIYPFNNELRGNKEKAMVYRIFTSPCAVQTAHVLNALDIFFSYSIATSCLTTKTIMDKVKVAWLEQRNRLYVNTRWSDIIYKLVHFFLKYLTTPRVPS